MNREPVITVGVITGIVMAFLAMAVSLNWLRVSSDQLNAIQSFLLPTLALVVPIVAAVYARMFVTPTAAPKTIDGQDAVLVPVKLVTPVMLDQIEDSSRSGPS